MGGMLAEADRGKAIRNPCAAAKKGDLLAAAVAWKKLPELFKEEMPWLDELREIVKTLGPKKRPKPSDDQMEFDDELYE
jgi:hypothetical protein